MDFESPDVEKDFPGLYASESSRKNQSLNSDYSDEEKTSKKDLLGKKKEKRESKKDKGYAAFVGESSGDDEENKSPGKSKKNKPSFKLVKDRKEKKKDKDAKDKKDEKEKVCKKESKELKKESKDAEKVKDKDKTKKKKEHKLLRIKDKKKKSIQQEIPGAEEKPIFGVPLHVAVERNKSHDGIEIPIIVRECIDYIEEHGLACEGIYKISGLKSKVRQLKAQYDKREKVYLYEHEPHIIASLLKQFLRDLPEPILTAELAGKFEDAAALKNEKKRAEALHKLVNDLPNCNRVLLSWIFIHMMHVVNLEKRNKMNIQNVSIALSPTLHISHHVLQALFAHSHILFKGVEIKKYVPPIELDSSRLSLELPDSPSAIAEELSRQENVLNYLHAELNSGVRDQEKEEKLWEIQRVVTQLKRKLRFRRQVQDATNTNISESQVNKDSMKKDLSLTENKDQVSNVETLDHSTPLKSKCPEGDISSNSKDHQSLTPQKVEDLKSPQDVNKPSEKSECTDVNIPIIPPPAKQHSEVKTTVKVPDPSIAEKKEICSVQVENSPSMEKVKPELDTPKDEETFGVSHFTSPMSKLPPLPNDNEDAEIDALTQELKMQQIQSEELMLLGDELRRKVFSEKMEIERLKTEIYEYQQLYRFKRYSFDSTENSSSESDDSSSDEEEMSSVVEELIKENMLLQAKNLELSKVVQAERETCLNIKVQLKMMQQFENRTDANFYTRM